MLITLACIVKLRTELALTNGICKKTTADRTIGGRNFIPYRGDLKITKKKPLYKGLKKNKATQTLMLDKSSLNHEMTILTTTRLLKTGTVKQATSIFQHAWATADHKTIIIDIQRRQTHIRHQLSAAN